MAEAEFDLFGNPVRPGKGSRGRPPFEVTDRNRNKVKLLLALGWSNDRIASAIECSPATLKRYFRAELKVRDDMRDRLDAERIMILAEQTMSGNVGAARELQRQIDRNDRMELERVLARKTSDQAKGQPGKKEIARDQARSAEDMLAAQLASEAAGHVKQ